jgi:hypothetical protein
MERIKTRSKLKNNMKYKILIVFFFHGHYSKYVRGPTKKSIQKVEFLQRNSWVLEHEL